MPIRVTCPNCLRGIKAPEKLAGKAVNCPGCQAPLRIPDASDPEPPGVVTQPPIHRAATSPAIEESEHTLLVVQPDFLRTGIGVFALAGMLVIGAVVVMVSNFFVGLYMIFLATAFVLIHWLRTKTTKLTISTHRSILTKGILSRRTSEVRHSDIRFIEVFQNLDHRLLGLGRLAVSSSAQSNCEIEITGIPNPQAVKETLNGLRRTNERR
jgi:membrane protein YdbS with pleckstrin-like domain